MTNTYCDYMDSPLGIIEVQASADGITAIGFVDIPRLAVNSNALTENAIAQLNSYFNRQLTRFDLPLAPQGTQFQQAVWQALLTIPYGKTGSYSDIAHAVGNPKAVRAVGAANGKNPIAIVVPCHRIIGKNGTLTGYAGGLQRKSALLELEQ